uniref:DUF1336 domain-containing protein n=1 Tax=Strongyloides papillosus TaxID=174720 RepID=A0A0N5B810_STREA
MSLNIKTCHFSQKNLLRKKMSSEDYYGSSLDVSSDEDIHIDFNSSISKTIHNQLHTPQNLHLVRAHTIAEMKFSGEEEVNKSSHEIKNSLTKEEPLTDLVDKLDTDIQNLLTINSLYNSSSSIDKKKDFVNNLNEEYDYISSDDHSNSSKLSSFSSSSNTDNIVTTFPEEFIQKSGNIPSNNNKFKPFKSTTKKLLRKSNSSVSNDSGIQLAVAGTKYIHCTEDPLAKIKNVKKERFMNIHKEEPLPYPKSFSWDWPYCNEGVAKGLYTAEAFTVCLPFNNGGTGVSNNTTRKFEKISESNFAWQVGLSNTSITGNCFWRMELEVIKGLNMIALIVSRDISRLDDTSKRLKRVRKVYKLPNYYDVTTLATKSYDWGIVLTANKREESRSGKSSKFKRADTYT